MKAGLPALDAYEVGRTDMRKQIAAWHLAEATRITAAAISGPVHADAFARAQWHQAAAIAIEAMT